MAQLIVTALGKDRIGIVSELSRVAAECHCNILDSRMAVFGSEFSFIMLLTGEPHNIDKVEAIMPEVSNSLNVLTMMKRTSGHVEKDIGYSATVEIAGLDGPGILAQVSTFFAKRGIDLGSVRMSTFKDDATGTNMNKAAMRINVPAKINLDILQSEFESVTEDLNLIGHMTKI